MVHVAVAMRCMCCQPMGGGGLALFRQLGRGSAMGIFLANMAHGGSASRSIGSVSLSVRCMFVPGGRRLAYPQAGVSPGRT